MLLCLLCYALKAPAQCTQTPVGITAAAEKSDLIVEGQVVRSKAFYSPYDGLIYTRHELKVSKAFKGAPSRRLFLLTLGGMLEQEALQVHPSLQIGNGQSGIFFLSVYNGQNLELQNTLRPAVGPASLIRYAPVGQMAYGFGQVFDNRKQLHRKLEKLSGQGKVEIGEQPTQPVLPKRSSMTIEHLSPANLRAGTEDTLLIAGGGFGNTAGFILFPNADSGGSGYTSTSPSHLISWTDTLIQTQLPHRAGTGKILLVSAAGFAFSQQSLTVDFAFRNLLSSGEWHRPRLVDEGPDDGGYRFLLPAYVAGSEWTFYEKKKSMQALQAAAKTWQQETQIPFYIGADCPLPDTLTPRPAQDSINLISFDSEGWSLAEEISPQVLAAAFTRYARCSSTEWEVTDIDILLRRGGEGGVPWSFEEEGPAAGSYDFQTVLSHEIGHALLLNHVISEDALMHYAVGAGQMRRELSENSDIAGGLYAMDLSLDYLPPVDNCWPAEHFDRERQLAPYADSLNCQDSLPAAAALAGAVQRSARSTKGMLMQVFPNPLPGQQQLQLNITAETAATLELRCFAVDGRLLAEQRIELEAGPNASRWQLPGLPAGLYFITTQYQGHTYTERLVVQP
jgi:hypothetical protein